MIIKEKLFFWVLLAVFIAILIIGFISQGKRKERENLLLEDIEIAAEKAIGKKKAFEDTLDLDSIRSVDSMAGYKTLLKRDLFFRVGSELKTKKTEAIPVREEPRKLLFRYKGKVMIGTQVMVIIEDEGTGKSFFVKVGDTIASFAVMRVDDKEVVLKNKDGEEIVLSVVKKEDEEGSED